MEGEMFNSTHYGSTIAISVNERGGQGFQDVKRAEHLVNVFMVNVIENIQKLFLLTVPWLFILMGTLGNFLVLQILRKKVFKQNILTLIFQALSVSDLMVLFTGMMRHSVLGLTNIDVRLISPKWCWYHSWVVYSLTATGNWIIIFLTLARILSIKYPVKIHSFYKREAIFELLMILLILNATYYYLTFQTYLHFIPGKGDGEEFAYCGLTYTTKDVDFYIQIGFYFVLPSILIWTMNVAVYLLHEQVILRHRAMLLRRFMSMRRNTTLSLIVSSGRRFTQTVMSISRRNTEDDKDSSTKSNKSSEKLTSKNKVKRTDITKGDYGSLGLPFEVVEAPQLSPTTELQGKNTETINNTATPLGYHVVAKTRPCSFSTDVDTGIRTETLRNDGNTVSTDKQEAFKGNSKKNVTGGSDIPGSTNINLEKFTKSLPEETFDTNGYRNVNLPSEAAKESYYSKHRVSVPEASRTFALSSTTLSSKSRHSPAAGQEKHLTTVLTLSCVLFVILNGPWSIYFVLNQALVDPYNDDRNNLVKAKWKLAEHVTNVLLFSNNAVNFLVYTVYGSRFRREFKRSLRSTFAFFGIKTRRFD